MTITNVYEPSEIICSTKKRKRWTLQKTANFERNLPSRGYAFAYCTKTLTEASIQISSIVAAVELITS